MPGSQNCSLNAHRKSSRNVLGVFDVKNAKRLFKLFWICSRGILSFDNLRSGIFFFLKGRRKNCRHFFYLRMRTAVWSLNNRERGNFGIYSLREFVHKKSKETFTNFYNHFLVSHNHQIYSVRFDDTFCGNSVNNLDVCRASSLFDWDLDRQANSSTPNPQQFIESLGYSKDTSLFLIKFERSCWSQFDKYL